MALERDFQTSICSSNLKQPSTYFMGFLPNFFFEKRGDCGGHLQQTAGSNLNRNTRSFVSDTLRGSQSAFNVPTIGDPLFHPRETPATSKQVPPRYCGDGRRLRCFSSQTAPFILFLPSTSIISKNVAGSHDLFHRSEGGYV